MKRFYLSALLLFGAMATYGQIKVVDDSFKTEGPSELSQTLDIGRFYEVFPKYEPNYPVLAYWDNSRWNHNSAVGEKFYVYKESPKQYVRIDPADSTACIASMPVGYYEITGEIFTSDRLNECKEDVLTKYRISPHERESIDARMSFINSEGATINQAKKFFAKLPSGWNIEVNYNEPFFPVHICTDSAGRIFYVPAACTHQGIKQNYVNNTGKNVNYQFEPLQYVMLSFYEEAVKRLKGQQIMIYGAAYITDQISGEYVKIPPIPKGRIISTKCIDERRDYYQAEINPNYEFMQCKDIVLKEDKILAIIECAGGSFATPILNKSHLEWQVPQHGYRGPDILVPCFKENIISKQDLERAVSDFNTHQNEIRDALLKDEQAREQYLRSEAQKEELRKQERLKNLTSKYGAEFAAAIAEGKVKIGMTQEMCREAWGTPSETFTTTTASGSTRVWIYGYKTRLLFINNRLSVIQN